MARVERIIQSDQPEPKKRCWLGFVKKVIFPKGCLMRVLGLVLLLVIGSMAWLAYLGLFEVPLLTTLLYKPITPVREIIVDSEDSEKIGSVISGRLEESAGLKFSLSLSEEELTSLIRSALMNNTELPFRNVQTAIEPQFIEIFGELVEEKRTYLVALNVIPVLEQRELQLQVVKSRIERLRIPSSLVELVVFDVISGSWKKFNEELDKYVILSDIELGLKEIRFIGRIINPILPF